MTAKKYQQPSLNISEAEWQTVVIDLAHAFGYRCVHWRPARVLRDGIETYETPVGGDGKDFPDCIFFKKDHPVIYAELKSEDGKVRPGQQEWLELIASCSMAEAFLWKPSDYEEVIRVLSQ